MSLPERTKPDFTARLSHQGFTGSKLVSKEELAEAVKQDRWLCMIDDYISQDEVQIAAYTKELQELYKQVQRLRAKRKTCKSRIQSRTRQKKYFIQLLRKKMAWEKIKQLREEIGLT